MVSPPRRRVVAGRLLNELLVGIALLFLALTVNFAVLNTGSRAAIEARAADRAAEIARDGMESLVANPAISLGERRFGEGKNSNLSGTFVRRIRLVALESEPRLVKGVVEVEWQLGETTRKLRVERYVRSY